MTLTVFRIWPFISSKMPIGTCPSAHTGATGLSRPSESSQTPWARLFPWTKVTMSRLEDLRSSRSENDNIPHLYALQSTGNLRGKWNTLLLFTRSYSLLREKKIIFYKINWRRPSTSEKGFRQALRLKVPMTRLFLGILTKENGQKKRRERARKHA